MTARPKPTLVAVPQSTEPPASRPPAPEDLLPQMIACRDDAARIVADFDRIIAEQGRVLARQRGVAFIRVEHLQREFG